MKKAHEAASISMPIPLTCSPNSRSHYMTCTKVPALMCIVITLFSLPHFLPSIWTHTLTQFMIKKHVLCDNCCGMGATSDSNIHACSECSGSSV